MVTSHPQFVLDLMKVLHSVSNIATDQLNIQDTVFDLPLETDTTAGN